MTSPIQPNTSLDALERAMQASLLRDQTIRANLANVNTPGYRRLEVQFESLLAQTIGSGPATASAICRTEPKVVRDTRPGDADGNNVELDSEYADMERNRIQFEALAEIASLRIQGLRGAINSR